MLKKFNQHEDAVRETKKDGGGTLDAEFCADIFANLKEGIWRNYGALL